MIIYSNEKALSSKDVNNYIFRDVSPKRAMYVHICIANMGVIEEVVQTSKL